MAGHVVPTLRLCVSRCGARAEVADGRMVALHPDPSHPTGKAICLKGKAAPEIVDHRDSGGQRGADGVRGAAGVAGVAGAAPGVGEVELQVEVVGGPQGEDPC